MVIKLKLLHYEENGINFSTLIQQNYLHNPYFSTILISTVRTVQNIIIQHDTTVHNELYCCMPHKDQLPSSDHRVCIVY